MHLNQTVPLTLFTAFLLGAAVSGVSGCNQPVSEPNDEHCWFAKGNATCNELFPDGDRPFCVGVGDGCASDNGFGGCVASLPTPDCYSPCGGEQLAADDSTCDPVAGDGDGDTTGDGDGDGEPTGCLSDGDCLDGGAPFCDQASGACVACDLVADGDAACAGLDASLPLCVAGACVACTEQDASACSGVTPVCDVASNACVGCSSHDQCPDSACNLAAGNCIDASAVVHVDGGVIVCDDAGDGSEATPYCSLSAALDNSPAEALIMLTGKDGGSAYNTDHTVSGTKVIFGFPSATNDLPVLQGANTSPAVTVSPSANLIMREVWVNSTPNGQPGLRINQSSAWLENLRIANNEGAGIAVAGGSVNAKQARIVNNDGGGIVVEAGGDLTVTNSFIGGDVNDQSAIRVTEGSATITYSTVAAGFGTSSALACGADQAVILRNSLLVSRSDADELQCASATATGCAMELANGDNLALGPVDIAWFTAYGSGDFSLATAPAELATAAAWAPGDPATDIDGDPRPTEAGPDYAGADIPAP